MPLQIHGLFLRQIGRAFRVSVSFQLPSVQNILYIKVAYSGVAYSAPFH